MHANERERRAVWLGPPGSGQVLAGALNGALELDEAADVEALVAAAGARDVALVAVDHARLDELDERALARATRRRGVPWVVVGCPSSESVAAVVERGAAAGVRQDAGSPEARLVIDGVRERRRLQRACRELERDLRRQSALAQKDDLTSAYNRRYFDRCLDEEIERARRSGGSVALIFMDIDNLKAVNQRWGHAMGSAVLREAAARTIRSIRGVDKVVRYGGDEFCIILPGSDAEGGLEVAERIRRDLATHPFAREGTGGVTLTASFGIAALPEHAADKDSLVAAADEAMFRIKDTQKNGILVAGAEVP